MVPNNEKLMEAFIEGLPRSIEGNVTASKPQTFEEAITITHRLMEKVIKHNSTQETNDHKRKFKDRKTSPTTTTTPMIALTNLTTIITTKITVTTTTTATIITTNSKMEGKKPPGLMPPPMGVHFYRAVCFETFRFSFWVMIVVAAGQSISLFRQNTQVLAAAQGLANKVIKLIHRWGYTDSIRDLGDSAAFDLELD
nr:reverse transcriptase domain-containing protein [Tanacetum cinerariifolium]